MIRILILDDDKLIRWSLAQILAQDGYAVDTAASTEEALALAEATEYALVITDLEVCGGQARLFFADLIAKQPRVRVITLTALPREEAEQALGDLATYAILEKPFASQAVRDLVHAAIGRASGRAER